MQHQQLPKKPVLLLLMVRTGTTNLVQTVSEQACVSCVEVDRCILQELAQMWLAKGVQEIIKTRPCLDDNDWAYRNREM